MNLEGSCSFSSRSPASLGLDGQHAFHRIPNCCHNFYTMVNIFFLIPCILSQQEFTGEHSSTAVTFVPESFKGDGPFKALLIASNSGDPNMQKCIASERDGTLSVKEFDPVYPHPGTMFVITKA